MSRYATISEDMSRSGSGKASNTESRFVPEKKKKLSDEAKILVEKFGVNYSSKKGGTLLHMNVDKPSVFIYVLANCGVPVNVQDVNRDTALHLAVRRGNMDAVVALVQCTADLTLRNKMGQTPVEEAEGITKTFLRTFEPGMVGAVRDSHCNTLYRLVKHAWCSIHTKVKEGQSLLEFTEAKARSMALSDMRFGNNSTIKMEVEAAKKSLRVLSDYRPTSELIHAVLCQDVELTRKVLRENDNLPVNVRFRDRIGKTLLSHAIESNHYELVKLLLDHGAHVNKIRVRENERTDVTIPLYQKALRSDLDVNIVKLLQRHLPDDKEHEEKDQNGNTPLLRAVEERVDSRTIHWLIWVRGGHSLMDRNKDGQTARDLAEKLGRDNVVKVIDKFIAKEVPVIVLRLFPTAFYSKDMLNIVDESGESIQQKLNKSAEAHNLKTWIDFNQAQDQAISLFAAAACGDVKKVQELNNACYQDKNGYTALIRAIVFNQLEVATLLCTTKPALKRTGDNCNRFPLHYAYALPEKQGMPFIRLLLEKDALEIENRVDKDGRLAADYKALRKDREILQMLYDARRLDVFGQRGSPLGPWPAGAERSPPGETAEE